MISVVIPLYNKNAHIAKTIESVLKQTFSNFEIVVINDGSTDGSEKIVEGFNDKRIKLYSQKNLGVAAARNSGIVHARYEYVAFLDADDWWAPTFLEEISNAIQNYPDQNIFATGRSRVFNPEIERYQNCYLPEEGITRLINYFEVISIDLPPINSSNSVFKKKIFSEIGNFKNGVSQHEDHDLWIRLAARNRVVFINKNLSFYRKTESHTASSRVYKMEDFLEYIHSMNTVLPMLSSDDTVWFLKYSNSFIFYSFIKNASKYNYKERRNLLAASSHLVKWQNLFFLRLVNPFLFFNFYNLYNFIKVHGR